MKPLNNKILFKPLAESFQPKNDVIHTSMTSMKYCKVLDVGNEVTDVKKDDVITLYVTTMRMITSDQGFCTERDVLFINGDPRDGKVQITDQQSPKLSPFSKGTVMTSSCPDVSPNDKVNYLSGQSHILPDGTELISKTQIFFKD